MTETIQCAGSLTPCRRKQPRAMCRFCHQVVPVSLDGRFLVHVRRPQIKRLRKYAPRAVGPMTGRVIMRMRESERVRIKEQADGLGISLSAYVRMRLGLDQETGGASGQSTV